jgi:predicted nucleic acid-binding protein
MIRVFVDTDILLDLITGRHPHGKEAASLFNLVDREKIVAYVSSLSFSNLYYILRKFSSHRKALDKLDLLAQMVEMLEVDAKMIKQALKSPFKDFEDAIQYYCASSNPQISVLVTRNIKDFKHADLPVMSPATFTASWHKSQDQA